MLEIVDIDLRSLSRRLAQRNRRVDELVRLSRRLRTLERESFIRETKGLTVDHVDAEIIDVVFLMNSLSNMAREAAR